MVIPLKKGIASQQNQSVILWVTTIHMVIVRFMMPWFAYLKTGRWGKFSLKCTGIMGLWMVIHQLPCGIPRHAYLKFRPIYYKISIKTQFHSPGILMIQKKNRLFYQQVFPIYWSMALLVSRQAMRLISLHII